MDSSVEAVLEAYHRRIEEEEAETGHRPGESAGEWRDRVLLAVGPETGRLLNILARSLKAPTMLELGTSYGYSAIWLGEAAKATGGKLISVETQDYKTEYAREKAEAAGLGDQIDFRVGDALEVIETLPSGIDFVLLDLWKDMYIPCLEALTPKLNPGALIVADNIVSPGGPNVKAYHEMAQSHPDLASVLLPVGAGLEVSVFKPSYPG